MYQVMDTSLYTVPGTGHWTGTVNFIVHCTGHWTVNKVLDIVHSTVHCTSYCQLKIYQVLDTTYTVHSTRYGALHIVQGTAQFIMYPVLHTTLYTLLYTVPGTSHCSRRQVFGNKNVNVQIICTKYCTTQWAHCELYKVVKLLCKKNKHHFTLRQVLHTVNCTS